MKKEVLYEELVEEYYHHGLVMTFVCPEGSRRNPTHLSGSVTHQVLKEKFYYLITPDNSLSWEYVTESPDFPPPEDIYVELGVPTEIVVL